MLLSYSIRFRPVPASRANLVVAASMVVMAVIAISPVDTCEAQEQTVKWKPVNWQTLDPHAVAKRYPTDSGGGYPKEWISTPPEPVVVRQDHPDGPTYQEALGYELLIYNFKFARMARMPDGTIVLRGVDYGEEDVAYIRKADGVPMKMFSHDGGDSWSGEGHGNQTMARPARALPRPGVDAVWTWRRIHQPL